MRIKFCAAAVLLTVLGVSQLVWGQSIGSQGAYFLGDEYGVPSIVRTMFSPNGERYPVESELGIGLWAYAMFQADNPPDTWIRSQVHGLDRSKFYVTHVGYLGATFGYPAWNDNHYYEPGYERDEDWHRVGDAHFNCIYTVWFVRPKLGFDWDDDPDQEFEIAGYASAGGQAQVGVGIPFRFEVKERVYTWPRSPGTVTFEAGRPNNLIGGQILHSDHIFGGGEYLYADTPAAFEVQFDAGKISFDKFVPGGWAVVLNVRFNVSEDDQSYYRLSIRNQVTRGDIVDVLEKVIDGVPTRLGDTQSLQFAGGHIEIERGLDGTICVWRNDELIFNLVDNTLMNAGDVIFKTYVHPRFTEYETGIDNVDIQIIPEPATLSLLVLGGLALIRRKRK